MMLMVSIQTQISQCCTCPPMPTNITKLQEFLGMVKFLSPFISGLSTLTAPLCKLLKKDTDFTWNHTYDAAFQHVKDAVISYTTLQYFDPSLPMTIQVDGSQVDLGAVLLQNHKPISFASKALTEIECCYTNIERKMLAVVFGAERFRTYVYGRSFTTESDHKPLESVSQKNLADTPSQLQHMLLHLQGYEYIIRYCPSKENSLPDALSHFSPHPGPDIPLDTAIHHAHLSPEQKEEFQKAFMSDSEMHTLADIIITSWPDDIKEVPHPLCPYWQYHESVTVKGGLVLHGEALVVPPSERERILHQLHQFHQGITKSKLLTCGCIFWPGINKAIEEVVHQSETWTQFQTWNVATPLTPTLTLSQPWQMCALDIFTLEVADYIICGDFYSKIILIWCLPSGQSNTTKVVSLLKMFSEHGIPEILHSDNSPQYTSAQFADFCTSWGITHETSSPHYPQSNGFAESCVKSVKLALQCAKYSGVYPQLILLALWATPIKAKLSSPAELLYQCQLRTTIPAKIHNTDPAALQVCEQIATHSDTFRWQTDKHCKSLAPLYAGQLVAMYDTLCKIWVPTTVVHVLPKDSYQVCTSDGNVYHCIRWHLCEHSVKPADTVPDTTITTPQAPARPHVSVPQPALTKPAQPAQPTPIAPATPETPQLFPPHQLSQRSPLCLQLWHSVAPCSPEDHVMLM